MWQAKTLVTKTYGDIPKGWKHTKNCKIWNKESYFGHGADQKTRS